MEFAKIGNTDLIISRLGLGCQGFGEPKSKPAKWTLSYMSSKNIIKNALKEEINYFDTAPNYSSGSSERYLGRAIKELTTRDQVIISTKFNPRNNEQIHMGLTAQKHIENSINKSLKNLQTDYVDLYVYHMWDYKTPIYDVMEGLNNIVKQGKARALGISNCFAWQLAEANILAKEEGFAQFNCVQNSYNLLFREDERELIPYCHMKNIALTPYSPLATGLLARKPNANTFRTRFDQNSKKHYGPTLEEDKVIIERVQQLASKYHCSMVEISLAWLLSKVTAPIIGITKLNQLKEAVKVFDLYLTPGDIEYLRSAYKPHKLRGVLNQINPYA